VIASFGPTPTCAWQSRHPSVRSLRNRSFPLAALRRYYPGFFGALFLILLRTAIGWHFFYEGVYKISTTPGQRDSYAGRALSWLLPAPRDKDKEVEPPFSAEGYLRNATGPMASKFRGMVPDVNSLAKLERDANGLPSRLKAGWKGDLDRISRHFAFLSDQTTASEKELANKSAEIDEWFLKPENALRIKKYYRDLRHVLDVEESPESLPYQRTLAYKQRQDVDKDRRALVNEIDTYSLSLRDAWLRLATPEQVKASGEYKPGMTQVDWVNLSTMWGLALVGLCLMLGLFTPLAALGGAAYLLMFYLSMPPWPGLPVGKAAEGHYLYVNKNMIELIACLALASTPNGLWLGLDALLFGKRARRREFAAQEAAAGSATPAVVVPIATTSNPRRL
jgi:uncharacterized membrane protein YphA (DoxX/SURF4 family)